MSATTVAVLYADPKGVYSTMPDVDLWDEKRDARRYAGPWPVVAHPPCARWSRLAGFVQARWGYKKGDDGGCFAAALDAVRTFGGVLEHPAYTDAWKAYDLPRPITHFGWTAGMCGGWSCYLEQGRYGLPVKKATWLYAYGVELVDLRWGFTPDGEGVPGAGNMDAWRDRFKGQAAAEWMDGTRPGRRMGLTSVTPPVFAEVLLSMARTAHVLAGETPK